MAEELRILKGDSHEIIITIKNSDETPVDIIGDEWNISLETDAGINKNSIDNYGDFVVDENVVTIYLSSNETGAIRGCPRKHYKIKLYNNTTTKTVSNGDLIFVDEI